MAPFLFGVIQMMRLILILAFLVLGGCAWLPVGPSGNHIAADSTKSWGARPSDYGLEYDDVIISASDGSRLHGWWLHARDEHRATVYFLHDLSGNVGDYLEDVSALPKKGIGVFMLDYRGFGLSEGKPDLAHIASDTVQGLDWLRKARRASAGAIVVLSQRRAIDPVKAELSREIYRGRFDCLLESSEATDLSALLAGGCPALQNNKPAADFDNSDSSTSERPPVLSAPSSRGSRFSF